MSGQLQNNVATGNGKISPEALLSALTSVLTNSNYDELLALALTCSEGEHVLRQQCLVKIREYKNSETANLLSHHRSTDFQSISTALFNHFASLDIDFTGEQYHDLHACILEWWPEISPECVENQSGFAKEECTPVVMSAFEAEIGHWVSDFNIALLAGLEKINAEQQKELLALQREGRPAEGTDSRADNHDSGTASLVEEAHGGAVAQDASAWNRFSEKLEHTDGMLKEYLKQLAFLREAFGRRGDQENLADLPAFRGVIEQIEHLRLHSPLSISHLKERLEQVQGYWDSIFSHNDDTSLSEDTSSQTDVADAAAENWEIVCTPETIRDALDQMGQKLCYEVKKTILPPVLERKLEEWTKKFPEKNIDTSPIFQTYCNNLTEIASRKVWSSAETRAVLMKLLEYSAQALESLNIDAIASQEDFKNLESKDNLSDDEKKNLTAKKTLELIVSLAEIVVQYEEFTQTLSDESQLEPSVREGLQSLRKKIWYELWTVTHEKVGDFLERAKQCQDKINKILAEYESLKKYLVEYDHTSPVRFIIHSQTLFLLTLNHCWQKTEEQGWKNLFQNYVDLEKILFTEEEMSPKVRKQGKVLLGMIWAELTCSKPSVPIAELNTMCVHMRLALSGNAEACTELVKQGAELTKRSKTKIFGGLLMVFAGLALIGLTVAATFFSAGVLAPVGVVGAWVGSGLIVAGAGFGGGSAAVALGSFICWQPAKDPLRKQIETFAGSVKKADKEKAKEAKKAQLALPATEQPLALEGAFPT
jgi:hypothetical protein